MLSKKYFYKENMDTNGTNNKQTQKSWKTSDFKWTYLRVALLHLTTPKTVYEIAHKSRGANMRERIIRSRLVDLGVLRKDVADNDSKIDLDNGHI